MCINLNVILDVTLKRGCTMKVSLESWLWVHRAGVDGQHVGGHPAWAD